jgi:hypothetical protein
MPAYSWVTFGQTKTDLAARLQDPNMVYWVDDELGRYIIEALRTWNSLVNVWWTDFDLSGILENGTIWYGLDAIPTYPRVRTVTDQELEILMAYHLIEPFGFGFGGFGYNFGFNFGIGFSNGTGMWSINDFSQALQRRRDEIIQLTAANIVEITLPGLPNVREYSLPDTVLSPLRSRWIPSSGSPNVLWRNDDLAEQYFAAGYLQRDPGTGQSPATGPKQYGVISGPPQGFTVDYPPLLPGTFDLLVNLSGPVLSPPNATVLGLPNDMCWIAKWGALSDLLGMESEVTDPFRADYCLQRYRDGITLMQACKWLGLATINGVAVETASVSEMDDYSVNWDSNSNAPVCVVTAGMDFLAVCPVPGATTPGATIRVVGNAPVPVFDTDFVQVSRDTYDVILDYAQHLADFKMAGSDFGQSKELAKNFFLRALSENSRLKQLGLFRDLLLTEGARQEEKDPRFVDQEEDVR